MPGLMSLSSFSDLPREFRFDASSWSFVTHGAVIRGLALSSGEASGVVGAKEQVQELYRRLYERAGLAAELAPNAVSRGFRSAPASGPKADRLDRTVLVYYDATSNKPSDRLAAYSHVSFDGERFLIAAIAVTSELQEAAVQQASHYLRVQKG